MTSLPETTCDVCLGTGRFPGSRESCARGCGLTGYRAFDNPKLLASAVARWLMVPMYRVYLIAEDAYQANALRAELVDGVVKAEIKFWKQFVEVNIDAAIVGPNAMDLYPFNDPSSMLVLVNPSKLNQEFVKQVAKRASVQRVICWLWR